MRPTLRILFVLCAFDPATPSSVLYGVTGTDLVTIHPGTGASTVVGPLGLSGNVTPGPLAWNPVDQKLYGLAYDYIIVGSTPVPTLQRFIQIEPSTGAASTVATFSPFTGPAYEAIEYVGGPVGSLIITRATAATSTFTTQLATITTPGAVTALVNTSPGIDNDLVAYDSGRHIFYSVDPNGTALVTRVDLADGTHFNLAGGLPSATTGELAYDAASDRLFALDYTLGNNSLYRINTAAGIGPVSFDPALNISGDQVRGIAFGAAIPEPITWASLTATTLGLYMIARSAHTTRR